MAESTTIVHVTHESIGKVGGIGAVLQGFFTSNAYLDSVSRSIILGPLFQFEGPLHKRLGDDVEVLYSSDDKIAGTKYASAFRKIESFYNVNIIYGKRTYYDPQTGVKSSPELLLFDIRNMKTKPINLFKKQLYEQFGIRSDLYEDLWEYEQYIRTAPVAIEAVKAIGAANQSTTIIAHEFMAMPTALAAILETDYNFKTIFYAHEVATIRNIIENHPGRETMFYNVVNHRKKNNLYLSDLFGDQSFYFKHPLVEAAKFCDRIFTVGDRVADELHFLAPEFESADINTVYNGIPAYKINTDEKLKSKQKLQRYCRNLLGYKPDFVFSHVTRLVKSKGLWRDLQVLENIEKNFQKLDKTGIMFLLSTEVSQRCKEDILNMEASYNWPVAHREGWPDLSKTEAQFYAKIQQFNAKARNIKVMFVNQFGFNQNCCGTKMPEDMEFIDLRRGTDVEFGLSIYEPFGISQLEPLTFGGICVISSVCGCSGFVSNVTKGKNIQNVIVADYTSLDGLKCNSLENLLQLDKTVIDQIERKMSGKIAEKVCSLLTENPTELDSLIQTGFSIAKNMSWETIVKNYLLPGLENSSTEQNIRKVCTKT